MGRQQVVNHNQIAALPLPDDGFRYVGTLQRFHHGCFDRRSVTVVRIVRQVRNIADRQKGLTDPLIKRRDIEERDVIEPGQLTGKRVAQHRIPHLTRPQ
ncbi:hypothetical protein D3C71_678420 [compost metagenome]